MGASQKIQPIFHLYTNIEVNISKNVRLFKRSFDFAIKGSLTNIHQELLHSITYSSNYIFQEANYFEYMCNQYLCKRSGLRHSVV